MAIGLKLDPVETGGLHPLGGIGVIGDDTGNIPILHHLGKGAMRRFAQGRGRQRRQPVAPVPAGAPPKVRELDHHRTAMIVALIGELFHPGHHLVAIRQDVVEGRRAVAADHCRSGGHGQGHTTARALDVIGAIAIFRQAILGIGGFMACGHDPVFQRQMLERIGLEQRVF